MNSYVKRTSAFLFALLFIFSFSGCSAIYKLTAPKEYKTSAEDSDEYPDDTVPIYDDAVVYRYSADDDTIEVTYGSADDFDDVAEFYADYFYDNDIYLSSEKDRSSEYLANGESGYYEFELTVEIPDGKWEERLYSSIVEIKLDKVNIPEKSKLYAYIEEVEQDFEEFDSIFGTSAMLDESEEEDLQFYIDALYGILDSLSALATRIGDRKVPSEEHFAEIHQSEEEMKNILVNVFTDYVEIYEYADAFIEASSEFVDFSDIYYEYYDDEFADVINIFDDYARDVEGLPTPSSIEAFSSTLVETLDETVETSKYCLNALDYGDNVSFYAGLYSYDINYRDLINSLNAFDSDIDLIGDRIEKDIERMLEIKDGIFEWLEGAKSDIISDSDILSEIPANLKIGEEKTEVSCKYQYPEYIIPANYRSLDYVAFLELFTNKGTANVKITVEIPGFTEKFEQKAVIARAETELKIRPPLVTGASDSLNSNKDAQLVITVEDLDSGEFVLQDTKNITLYSRYDMQWYDENETSYIENILAWVTPEAPQINTLLREAADSAYYLTDGELDSILGYQEYGDWSYAYITYVQALAIMHALATQMEVKYIAEPFSSTSTALQRVKTPAQVIDSRGGLCAETSVTVASALQAIGMHPVLIFPPGHVQVAVETWYGSHEYLLIETTALTSAANGYYDDVIVFPEQYEWDNYLSGDYFVVIDCALADQYGIKAID